MKKILLAALGAICSPLAFAETYYVSHTGDDGNSGLEGNPVKTIVAAYSKAGSGDEIILEKSATAYIADDLTVAKDVTIHSATGIPEDVLVTRSGDYRVFKLNNAGAVLRGLTITGGNCKAVAGGGNVYIDSNGGVVENCIIRNANINAESCKGGSGVYINSANGRVSNCVITNNLSGYQTNYGAVVLNQAGLVENCFIAYNKCSSSRIGVNMQGAGVYAAVTGAKVLNCTIYANEAVGYAGVYAGNNGALFQNCLIWDNKGVAGSTGGYNDVVGGNINSSTFRNCAARTSDIKDNQSHFIALASLPAEGALLRPVAGSPLIGAGAVHASAVSMTDIEGNPRKTGDNIDIGCCQYLGTAPSVGMTISRRVFRTSENVTVTFTATADNLEASSYAWNFGDGETDVTTDASTTHVYTESGKFSPSVTVGSVTYTARDEIRSLPDTMYVVAANAGEAYPYATKATAAKLPETAIAAAEVDGIEVVIAQGTYVSTATPVIRTGITVRGETGKSEDVTITGGGNGSNVRGPYLNHAQARLQSVTLSGGNEQAGYGNDVQGTGLCISGAGGVVSNCVVQSVKPSGRVLSAIYLSTSAARVTHTKVTSCTTGETSEIGIFRVTGGTVDNCLITSNSKANSSYAKDGAAVIVNGGTAVIRNCTIVRNTTPTCGGAIVYNGIVRNCVFAGNSAGLKVNANNYWVEHAARFDHCASDDAAPINATCFADTKENLFSNYASDDYMPKAGGPLFNTGVNPEPCEATDYADNKRISGGTIDIGAYEADAEVFDFEILSDKTESLVPATVTYSAGFTGTNGTDEIRCYWSFDGGVTYHETMNSIEWSYATAALNDVTLIVSNLTTTAGLEKTKAGAVKTLPKTMYVVADNPNAVWPYASCATAAKSLDTAYAEMLTGGEIVLSNGVHWTTSNGLSFNKGVCVRGVTGNPADVTILPRNTIYQSCSYGYTLDHAQSFVRDLTLEGKEGLRSAVLKIATNGGTVSNCVLRAGVANDHWVLGAAAHLNSTAALVTHCVITNNDVTYAGTGKAVVYDDKGGRVSNCLIADNVVSEEMPENPRAIAIVKSVGLVDNCTIVANTTCGEQYQLFPTQDTGADGCAVNCLVAANETNGVACAYVPSTYRVVNCLTDGTTPIGVDGHVAELSDIFADAAAGDWHLRVGVRSPAVNRGRTDLGWGTACVPPVDLNGQARIEANKIDIGCYEGVFIPLGVILIFR